METDLFLRVLFKGLYRDIKRHRVTGKSLKLFLPYSVSYEDNNPAKPIVRLIDPSDIEAIPDLKVYRAFKENHKNKVVVARAISQGRKNCELYRMIVSLNRKAGSDGYSDRFFISKDATGDKQYRKLINSSVQDEEDEYDVDEFGLLYPTLAVVSQEDFNVIGAVSIDFGVNISNDVADVFKDSMEPFHFLNAWTFEQLSIRSFYNTDDDKNKLFNHPNHTFNSMTVDQREILKFQVYKYYDEIFSVEDTALLKNIETLIQGESLHFFWKLFFGNPRGCLALWKALSEDADIIKSITPADIANGNRLKYSCKFQSLPSVKLMNIGLGRMLRYLGNPQVMLNKVSPNLVSVCFTWDYSFKKKSSIEVIREVDGILVSEMNNKSPSDFASELLRIRSALSELKGSQLSCASFLCHPTAKEEELFSAKFDMSFIIFDKDPQVVDENKLVECQLVICIKGIIE